MDRRSSRSFVPLDIRSKGPEILGPVSKSAASGLSAGTGTPSFPGLDAAPAVAAAACKSTPRDLENSLSALSVPVPALSRRTLVAAIAVFLLLLAGLGAFSSAARAAAPLDLDTLSGTEAEEMLEAGEITSVELTTDYLERIESFNKAGPGLNAVTQINKYALAEAAKSDSERALGIDLGPAMGLPILLKDIIDAKGMYTSAGDWALRNSYPEKDSGVAKELRAHGVILLGKLGLSEWANSFGSQPSGFSNLTGQVLNALDAAQGPSGSSSGSGAAASSAMAALTIGTETSGSIISPSTSQGDVGLRPTLGLVPGYGIAPISASQDTAGPIVRTVSDAAITLQSIAEVTGTDPEANAEYEGMMGPHFLENGDIQPAPFTKLPDYSEAINPNFVQGKRIGYNGTTEATLKAKAALEAAGAIMVLDEKTTPVTVNLPLQYEEHATINEYYKHLGPDVPVKSLEEEVAVDNTNPQEGEKDGNKEHAKEALAEITPGGKNQLEYEALLPQRKANYHAAIESMMNNPSGGGGPVIAVIGSVPDGPQAGDPEIAVPMGYSATQRRNQAVDVNGGAYDDYNLLGVAYVIEQGKGTPETADDYSALVVPQGSALVGVADRAGDPVLTVPAGFAAQNVSTGTGGDPVGVDLIGTKDSEATLLADGYVLEQNLKARQLGPEFMRVANPSVSGAPSETNQSMFRCVEGSAFYKPYDCNPGEVGVDALKIAGEGKLETPGSPETGGSTGTPPTPPVSPTPTPTPSPAPKPKVELLGKPHVSGSGKATIKIHVSGPGKAMVTGPDIKEVVVKVKKAGTVTLPITLKPAQKRTLAAKSKVKVKVKLAFVATDGAKTTKTVELTLVGKH
jgi:Asp-tRNA(Asn)/Glu-tRNA(Gln) amidotransferase A subunit family amidase